MSEKHKPLVKTASEEEQADNIQNYYKLQSKIYDATRWSFLFGRLKLIDILPFDRHANFKILEIGCGTGYNLKRLAKAFPNAQLTGLDVSEDMINLSRKNTSAFEDRVTLLQQPYGPDQPPMPESYDAIVCAYVLTMINPHWEAIVRHAPKDLNSGGVIAFADFHDSRRFWFKKHMSNHHVRMDGHIMPVLKEVFDTQVAEVKPAYGGIWEYAVYLGKKK